MTKQILLTVLFLGGIFHSTLLLAQNVNQTPKSEAYSPSAKAIWSTLLTGRYSPEILQWHVEQRKKLFVQRPNSLNQQNQQNNVLSDNFAYKQQPRFAYKQQPRLTNPPQFQNGWRNFEQESSFSDNNNAIVYQNQQQMPQTINDWENKKNSSEYVQMLRRMEFSLSSKNIPTESKSAPITQPPTSAVLAKLIIGHSNDEIKKWKNENSQLAFRQAQPKPQPLRIESLMSPAQSDYIAVLIPANSQILNVPTQQLLAGNEKDNIFLNYSSAVIPSYPNEETSSLFSDEIAQNADSSSKIIPASALLDQSAMNVRPALYIQPTLGSSQIENSTAEPVSSEWDNDRFIDDGLRNKPQKMKVYRPKESSSTSSSLPVASPLQTQNTNQTTINPDQNGWSNQQK
ncbi:MAG: hypothetical protein Q4C95_01210 [Planctomycetia bacterium]|nr:hypothetical protein [Planctomycetia bacterium]